MTRLRVLLIGLLLLWSQLAAAAHAIEHLPEDADGHPPACEWCLVFANVQHGAAASPPTLPAASSRPLPVGCIEPRRDAAFTPAYLSRAPPQPLV